MQASALIKDDVISAVNANDRQKLDRVLQNFSATSSGNIMELVDCGIIVRNMGRYSDADVILDCVLSLDSRNPFALYEIAWSKFLSGDHYSSLRYINKLLEYHPNDYRGLLFAVRILHAMEWFEPTVKYLDALRAVYSDHSNASIWAEYGAFVARFPKSYGVYASLLLETAPNYAGAAEVSSLIEKHIHDKSGFSLIRMGDGEGAFIKINDEDERRFASLYRHNRLDRSNVWFNGELDIYASGFYDDVSCISQVMLNANVVGVPYSSRMRMEYEIASIVSVSSLVNILRVAEDREANTYFCSQDIHMDLLLSGHMNTLLQSVSEIGLVSCHEQLPEILQKKYGISSVDFYKIPGEKLFNHAIGENSSRGDHYPARYKEIIESLQYKDISGKLFLVGGGILGKFYCDKIKERGGIALDIGSLADAWVGAITRPQHADLIAALS